MTKTPLTRRRAPHTIEALEARIAPATLVSLDGTTHALSVQGDFVDDGSSNVQAGAAEALSFSVSGGNLLITDPAHHVTASGAGVTQVTTGQVSIPLALLTGDLLIETGTGSDSLTFNNTLALAANHSLTAHTPGTISFAAGSGFSATGTGGIALTTEQNVSLAGGSSLTTVDGALSVLANQQAAPTAGIFDGIVVNASTLHVTGAGVLTVKGTGGTSGTDSYGVDVANGGTILGGTSGTMLVQGSSGASLGDGATGVVMTDTGSAIGSAGANVQVVGFGQGVSTSLASAGILLSNGTVSAGGTGTLSLQGTGSSSAAADGASGIVINGPVALSTNNGAITLNGTAGGSAAGNLANGVSVQLATISAGGAGSQISITGTGGAGMGPGFRLEGSSITTNGGDVLITATPGAGGIAANYEAIEFSAAGASIDTSVHGGNITLIGDSMELLFGSLTADSSHTVTFRPLNAGTAIDLGGPSSAGPKTLGLTGAELSLATAGTVQIGDANSGAITLSAALTHANNLSLTTGSGISGSGDLTLSAGKSVTLAEGGLLNLTGAITVPGTLTISGVGADIDMSLTNAANDFNVVDLHRGASVSLRDDSGFKLTAQVFTQLTLNSAGTITQAGTITGNGDLVKTGAGTLQLSKANIIRNTTISAGTITFSDPSALGSGTVTLGDTNTGNSNVSLLDAGNQTFLANAIVVTNSGTGVNTLGSVAAANGAVGFTGTIALNAPTTFSAGAATVTLFTGPVSGAVGTLTVTGGQRVILNGPNTFSGNVQVSGAGTTLQVGDGGDVIPDASSVALDAGTTLRLAGSGGQESIDGLTGLGTVMAFGNGGQTLTIGANGGTFQFDGDFADGSQPLSPLTLMKAGAGRATLTGNLGYSGSTVVVAGTLALNNSDFDNPISTSPLIDLRAGGTLDVTGLTPAGDPQTLALAPGQTLIGNGTIVGSLAGSGLVEPGTATAPGVLTINGGFAPAGKVMLKLISPYTTPGTDFDQIVVSGTVDLTNANLQLMGGDTVPTPGQTAQLITKNGPGAIVAIPSLNGGSLVFAGHSGFSLSYQGGDGNDLVLTAATSQASFTPTLVKGQLVLSNTSGRSSQLTVFISLGTDLIISSSLDTFVGSGVGTVATSPFGNPFLDVPLSKLPKGIVINGGSGDDNLIVDLTFANVPAGGLTFNGGAQVNTTGDRLTIMGGAEGLVTYTFANAHDGSVAMSAQGKINYTGLEPIVNTGSATDVVFNLPAGGTVATLGDDGTIGNGLSRLSGSTFELTDFASPSGAVTIHRGSATDFLRLNSVPDLTSGLTIGSPAAPFGNVAVLSAVDIHHALNLAASNFLLGAGLSIAGSSGTLTLGGGTVDGTIDGGLGITKFDINDLFLNGANTYSGETFLPSGPLDLGNALAVQNSIVRIGSSFALSFVSGIGSFNVAGLAGSGALALIDGNAAAVTLNVQADGAESTYGGSLSGPGTLHISGAVILTLTGVNTHAGTFVEGGAILQFNNDHALGQPGAVLTMDGGTLHATSTLTTARPILLASSSTFEAAPGKTLTLAGVISGPGDLLIGDTGTVLVTNVNNTDTGAVEIGGGTRQMVNGVAISAPGTHGDIKVTPGATADTIAEVDLTAANEASVSLIIKGPKTGSATVDKIVSNDNTAIKMISLGANVILGDGTADTVPDVLIDGKLTTLLVADVNANALIELGKGLAYLDTYKNAPNVTLHNVLGAGVTIDVTGDGTTKAGVGGGGLGNIIVNKWASPGLIKTTQGIKSFTVKSGDSDVSIQADPNHLGAATVANVGSISIPTGQWAGTGMEVEGVVAKFLTKGLAVGSTLSAGAFGTVNIKGTFGGSLVATYDASVATPVKNKPAKVIATGGIASVAISSGDFTGLVSGDGKVGNITLTGTGRFGGTLRGGSIGNITATSFTGTPAVVGGARHTITSIGSIGNITATAGGLTDYIIAAGVDLGSDALFGGVADHFTSYTASATGVITPVSIGSVTIKGNVTGTTIAAGVTPGVAGIFGGVADAVLALPAGTKGKTKIGAMKFDASGADGLGFTDTTGQGVSDAFEAQTLTRVQVGPGSTASTLLKNFDKTHYIISGMDPSIAPIIVQQLP